MRGRVVKVPAGLLLNYEHPEFDMGMELLACLPIYIPGQANRLPPREWSAAWPKDLMPDLGIASKSEIKCAGIRRVDVSLVTVIRTR